MKNAITCIYIPFLLLLFSPVFGQDETVIKPVEVGQQCPDFKLEHIVNYPTSTARISDFRGKLLILDFWATWCSPCVASFPKRDSLQKEFGDQLMILPVTAESKSAIQYAIDRLKDVRNVIVPSVTSDKVLSKAFPYKVIPHYVWIDKNGVVMAMTGSDAVKAENIGSIISGKKSSIKSTAFTYKSVNNGTSLFSMGILYKDSGVLKAQAVNDSSIVFRSAITRGLAGFRGPSSGMKNRVGMINATIPWMYKVALFENGEEVLNESLMQVQVEDSALYYKLQAPKDISAGYMSAKWLFENGYGYELVVPKSMEHMKYKIMLEDLNRYFGNLLGIEGKLEKRKVKCLELIKAGPDDLISAKGGDMDMKASSNGLLLKNCIFFNFIQQFNFYFQNMPPIVDRTGYKGRVDIDLRCRMGNLDSVNQALQKYGLKFQEAETEMNVAVVKRIAAK